MKCIDAAPAAAVASLMLFAGTAAAATVVQPPFSASYQLYTVSFPVAPFPVPSPFAAIAFRPGDANTLLMGGSSFQDTASVYAIGLTRDAGNHVVGIADHAAQVYTAPGFPGSGRGLSAGLSFGPHGVLFYTSEVDHQLGMIEPGSTGPDKLIDTSALVPLPMLHVNPLVFVPPGVAGAGRLKAASASGEFFDVSVAPDHAGAFDITGVTAIGTLPGTGVNASGDTNASTGLGYIAAGNPRFFQDNLVASVCDYNRGDSDLIAFDIDAAGNPILDTQRVMIKGLCATGLAMDPVTGDLLFASNYGFPALYVLKGFTVPPAAVAFSKSAYGVAETTSSVRITVLRQGGNTRGLTVHYATSAGSAVSGVNYDDVSGTLHWNAGFAQPQSFAIPIHPDGVYTGRRTVNLDIDGVAAATTLTIADQDPKPVVSLTSIDRTVMESVGTITLTATLGHVAGVPVTVPLVFSGTATRSTDYRFDKDLNNHPITAIVIPPGSSSGTLNIRIVNDLATEGAETIIATMGSPVNAVAGAVTANTITVQASD